MSSRVAGWILLAVFALAAVVLFNHWASFQPLSALAYAGMVLALAGLANLALPFRFLGIRRRSAGAVIFGGGLALTAVALLWPAPMLRVAVPGSHLDDVLPEYQFSERHSLRIHARPEQVMQAVRGSTWGDLPSLTTLLKIRGAVLREPWRDTGAFARDQGVLEAFRASGFFFGGSDHEILIAGAIDMRARRRPELHSLQEVADYREQGWIKNAFDFEVKDAGGGWSTLTTETRMAVQPELSRGPAIYWRLIVPGSGLLRREWLRSIRRRAETGPEHALRMPFSPGHAQRSVAGSSC
jgi:hypothetical protein